MKVESLSRSHMPQPITNFSDLSEERCRTRLPGMSKPTPQVIESALLAVASDVVGIYEHVTGRPATEVEKLVLVLSTVRTAGPLVQAHLARHVEGEPLARR